MIKLIVSDLDGTLLNHGGISNGNLKAINYALDKGVKLVLATGRDYYMIVPIIEKYQLKCLSIVGNGAQFIDEDGVLVEDAYLKKENYKTVTTVLMENEIPFMVYTTNGFYTHYEPTFVRDAFLERGKQRFNSTDEEMKERQKSMPCMFLKKIEDVDVFLNTNPELIKIEAFSLDGESVIDDVKQKLSHINGISYLSSFNDNVEITDKDAQKGIILECVCEKLNIQHDEVMVLGDGMNDMSMFERFKYSFAPSNAQREILEAAYEVVGACEDDGFSEAVYKMI